jgi:hypothetical protein
MWKIMQIRNGNDFFLYTQKMWKHSIINWINRMYSNIIAIKKNLKSFNITHSGSVLFS